ncbi:MAG: hydrogenase formation protein HypD [Ignavibacteria bacterium]|jgi:hydrogenase expression/formation protein HypD|nr:hydrogenase formation protein HypD [Ignavibacteria bacterium]MDH7528364.1 hydrogenase formation protein HypD [Ignavibacteria bacterium]
MKYLSEFRNPEAAQNLALKIKEVTKRNWTIMEVCGGQTHSILKYNIDELLPDKIRLIHGPGCPVCVTPLEMIDKAIEIASQPDVIFTSFGDMLRVPGSKLDLLSVKANGGDVRMVYSPLDAVKIAQSNPDKKVVFFAVGFETTAPANGMSVLRAKELGLKNYSILCSHVLVPPAIEALMSGFNSSINGFLAAGHVCTVMGYEEYLPLAEKYKIPIVVTGFEPIDILQGILKCVTLLEEGKNIVENQYSRVVRKEGNLAAKEVIKKVFEITDRKWRGIGLIPKSGLKLKDEFSDFDAEKIFDIKNLQVDEPEVCIAGEVLQGLKLPIECPAFGKECTPENPLGAPMVSSEGACAAYFHYKKVKIN